MTFFRHESVISMIWSTSYRGPPKSLVCGSKLAGNFGQITESYPESTNPYRIIPLITESYPYTKSHPNMGYDSVICHCLGYDLVSCQSGLKLRRR